MPEMEGKLNEKSLYFAGILVSLLGRDISRSLLSVAGIGVSFNFPSISGIWLSISV
jgi:hypothetical protein